MPEYTITQGDNEEIIAKDDDNAYRIRIFGAPVKITRTGDPRYSGDGLTYNVGYVGPIHNDGGARVFAENTGSGPDAKIEIDADLSAAGAFDPENSGVQTVSDDGNFSADVTDRAARVLGNVDVDDRAAREIGKARLEDSSGTLIDPKKQIDHVSTYTTVDLTLNATTTLFAPTNDAEVSGIFMTASGGADDTQLEVTDGTDAVVLATASGGAGYQFADDLKLASGDSLQINVTSTGTGSSTAVVLGGEL